MTATMNREWKDDTILALAMIAAITLGLTLGGCPKPIPGPVPPVVDSSSCSAPTHPADADLCGSFNSQARACVKCKGQSACIDPEAKVYCVRVNVNGIPDCTDPACVTP